MSANHSRGPWRYVGFLSSIGAHLVTDWNGAHIATIGGPPDNEVARANGHVAAAAPDLLEMCRVAYSIEMSVTRGQETELRDGFLEGLRAAIRKAEGRDA